MIVYIAGKIKGIEDYKEKFGRAQEYLEDLGHIVLNPAMLPKGMPEEKYMPICLAMLEQADALFLMDSAVFSEGARVERKFAEYQKKKIFFTKPEETLLDRYESVMKRLNPQTLLSLPDEMSAKLKGITDLKTKVKALEDLADCLDRQGLK